MESSWYISELYKDLITIITAKSTPSYFITFTANAQWEEIT